MKTLKELKNFCEKNNVRYEINAIYGKPFDILEYKDGKFKFVEHRTLLGYEIGMNNIAGKRGRSEWQWTWFETIGCFKESEQPNDDTKFYFRERYSMVNGKSNKGWREAMKVEDTIERRMTE